MWSKPINLGDKLNSSYTEAVPSIAPDGKYLLISRYNEEDGVSNFYLVSINIITNHFHSEWIRTYIIGKL